MAKPGPKQGSTKIDFTDQKILDEITHLISKGYTEASIAKRFGYTPSWFSEMKKKNLKLTEAIKSGRSNVEQLVYDKLFMMMTNDDHPKQFNALVFYAKCQLGWNDRHDSVIEQTPRTTSLNFKPLKEE